MVSLAETRTNLRRLIEEVIISIDDTKRDAQAIDTLSQSMVDIQGNIIVRLHITDYNKRLLTDLENLISYFESSENYISNLPKHLRYLKKLFFSYKDLIEAVAAGHMEIKFAEQIVDMARNISNHVKILREQVSELRFNLEHSVKDKNIVERYNISLAEESTEEPEGEGGRGEAKMSRRI